MYCAHLLTLHRLPKIVLADKYDRYKLTYSGCHVFNPGSFIGNNYSFSAYKPAEMNSEEWYGKPVARLHNVLIVF